MKIFNNNSINKVMNAYKKTNKNEVSENNRLGKKDEFTISKEAKDIQRAFKIAKESPDIRKEKVEEIKARYDSGNYNIDPKKVVEKMIEDIKIRNDY
ncbi:flagellar biosynthesis anti-sigma factor FlgM [Clostridium sp. D2Q-14]|uniref:flagellar biosynthesis anti-sigma factor FlgM n=1 Tax=Anaeromonas gelatinilytica TaxID=2683194 RepID=UPI00193B013A|nr:flagellar biosynthesis anti-sigma factor FlgM [Anaeromonas gelatinilytica]MBS4535789.1 flagellar biosynthesis anti-sigma factor FlgM [Anaeromonas gelatinilytica]